MGYDEDEAEALDSIFLSPVDQFVHLAFHHAVFGPAWYMKQIKVLTDYQEAVNAVS